MKNIYLTVITLISFMICFTSCSSSEEEAINQPKPGEKMIITASHGNKPSGRVVYEDDGLTMKWTEGDSFALYGDDRKEFTLVSGFEGSTSGKFEGTTPEGTPQKAFYPFSSSNAASWDDCMLNVTGQKQTVSGNMGHLPGYTFLSGDITVGNDSKKTVDFAHQTTLMKFVLTLPENIKMSETLQTFHLSTNQTDAFTLQKGVSSNSTVEVKKGKVISLDVTDMNVGDDNKITLYMMVLPFSLKENSKLILTIDTETTSGDGRYYDFTATTGIGGKVYEAGSKYTAEVDLEPVSYKKSGDNILYPTKYTNTVTGEFFYIVSPEDDTLFQHSDRSAYSINNTTEWDFMSLSDMKGILGHSGLTTSFTEYQLVTVPEFRGDFLIWGNNFNATMIYLFTFTDLEGVPKVRISSYISNSVSGLIRLLYIKNK